MYWILWSVFSVANILLLIWSIHHHRQAQRWYGELNKRSAKIWWQGYTARMDHQYLNIPKPQNPYEKAK